MLVDFSGLEARLGRARHEEIGQAADVSCKVTVHYAVFRPPYSFNPTRMFSGLGEMRLEPMNK